MKKVGITTFHNAHNYGAMLQSFALCSVLGDKYEVELVNYFNHKIYDQYKIIRPFGKNPFRLLRNLGDDIFHLNSRKNRYNSFEHFMSTNCKMSKMVYSEGELKNVDYDVLITGSDQVWNPKIVGELSNIFTLNFGSDNIKRISYAASVGDAKMISLNKIEFKKKLAALDMVSVREQDAKEELDKILEKEVTVVLDPTLLLTTDQWNIKLKGIKKQEEKYILAYVVQPDDTYVKIVNDLSEKTGLKVIHFGLKNPGYKNVLKSAFSEGPLEFVDYIKNAEYVVATSFHATVFSIIFHKKFFVIPHRVTGARVTNLLDKLNIKNRNFNCFGEFQNIDYNFETNWNKVDKILDNERKKSIEWLISSIEE